MAASVAVADQSDGFVPALRVDLLHHSVDVILDGEFGQIQIGGDFLVAQPHGDQGHKLALALGELK